MILRGTTWSANELVTRIFLTAWKRILVFTYSFNDKMLQRLLQNKNISHRLRKNYIILIFVWLFFPIDTKPINKQSPYLENVQRVDVKKGSLNETISRVEDSDESNPSEIQKAVCTVTAGDVRASAEAVTTKALKGVCGSTEMHKAFYNMESRLNKELEIIKNILVSLSQEGCSRITSDNISPNTKPIVKLQPIPLPSNNYSLAQIREREILVYNNTVLTEKDLKIFTYYWKIEHFTKKIENGSGINIQSSPAFSIKGKTLKIKASFQHLHRDFLFLQLVDASLHGGTGNSVILDTGGLFKEIQNDHFKYKMSVLDQNAQRSKDLVSQEFDNFETGFMVPNSALLDSPFIKHDSLLIKIFLYL